uniref:Thiamine pyrimidine synthase n=1 Tax=Chlamydomonas leiostraca TaxID=1034604 RepID=A0A7S0S6H2_9CHLO|mmetsp:Transcript_9303/g.23056  ORF Transcript_9303/g.23056 Transcript_9303/m.23056 type:complete len:346 (+) Transcript_9303:104-1141(+)|eukprot:CAMPEP_0202858202 /NCGR_PEP_ID=MMETSP1391-20130828/833_1 /ASSEMBLY_ACC=CAM_ASM_000867 /TAXON_ID=1034604 /ORGANISM="Chlamydomonas leiostraca, Strain SAG 11-49" /LENGTH=345 /DNA_ID=CAMNT_0049537091 /DNA_START=102 /DNA_END=1139 /DNA_ORIENTATION=+
MAKPISLALDWTPNCNHTGFFLAKAKGWYREAGLDVTLLSPHTDDYKTTPLSRVADKTATFAITPSESVISYHTWPGGAKPKVVSVATLLQGSTSAVVALKSSGIERPAQLDGKKYASYGARYEGRIVQQLIKNDGGRGEYTEVTPPMLGIWNTILKGDMDATWVFLGWEGVEAEMRGVELNVFKLEDYRVAYGHSPLLVAHPDTLSAEGDAVRAFMAASARGFEYAAAHPHEAAGALVGAVAAEYAAHPLPQPLDPEFVAKAQEYTSRHYLTAEGKWGVQSEHVWGAFLDWLSDSGLLTRKVQSRAGPSDTTTTLDGLRQGDAGEPIPRGEVPASSLFTNAHLP